MDIGELSNWKPIGIEGERGDVKIATLTGAKLMANNKFMKTFLISSSLTDVDDGDEFERPP